MQARTPMRLAEAVIQFWTIEEVAEMFRVSRRTMVEFCRRHGMGRTLGRQILFTEADIRSAYAAWRGEGGDLVEAAEVIDLEARRKADEKAEKQAAAQHPEADGFVYFFRSGRFVKIGWSRDWKKRLNHIKTACPEEVDVLRILPGKKADEVAMHNRFIAQHFRGEWFLLEGKLLKYLETPYV